MRNVYVHHNHLSSPQSLHICTQDNPKTHTFEHYQRQPNTTRSIKKEDITFVNVFMPWGKFHVAMGLKSQNTWHKKGVAKKKCRDTEDIRIWHEHVFVASNAQTMILTWFLYFSLIFVSWNYLRIMCFRPDSLFIAIKSHHYSTVKLQF